MSQRRTTVPPAHESSPIVASRTVRADCKDKTEKQSAKRRTVLDNRFHRTDLRFSGFVPRSDRGNQPSRWRTKSAATAS